MHTSGSSTYTRIVSLPVQNCNCELPLPSKGLSPIRLQDPSATTALCRCWSNSLRGLLRCDVVPWMPTNPFSPPHFSLVRVILLTETLQNNVRKQESSQIQCPSPRSSSLAMSLDRDKDYATDVTGASNTNAILPCPLQTPACRPPCNVRTTGGSLPPCSPLQP